MLIKEVAEIIDRTISEFADRYLRTEHGETSTDNLAHIESRLYDIGEKLDRLCDIMEGK